MIDEPYKPDAADKTFVDAFAKLPDHLRIGGYWSDPAVEDFKGKVKKHYIKDQKFLCCYCSKEILTENKRVWDLEHIICRNIRPEYMFEPENLAVSCVPCNIAKSSKNVSKGKKYKKFPRRSVSYIIVHPHFDKYEEHIRVFAGLVYVPVNGSSKGRETIDVCNLSRFGDIFEGKLGPVGDSRYEVDVAQLLFAQDKEDALAAARKLLTAFEKGPLE